MQMEILVYEQKLLKMIRTLSPAALEQTLDFVAFLQIKQTTNHNFTPVTNTNALTLFPLANTVLKYEDPTEPVAESDWEVLQ